jgi:FkbM family methyltransferase
MNIVQIGCNDGNDHVFSYIKSNPNIDNIILIDANIGALNKCKETYANVPNCTFLHNAIVVDDSKFVNLYAPKDQSYDAHSSLVFDHLIKHHHQNIETISVPAININDLLSKYKPDRLYIDAEGLDSVIVGSIDFTKHVVPYIFFEFVHSDGAFNIGSNFEKTKNILLNYNYKLVVVDTNIEASLT